MEMKKNETTGNDKKSLSLFFFLTLLFIPAVFILYGFYFSRPLIAGPAVRPERRVIPPNDSKIKLPLRDINICLIDDYKTAEIIIESDFTLKILAGEKNKNTAPIQGNKLKLYISGITRSKPAVIKYYAVLKTFPYSHLFRGDKKAAAFEALDSLEAVFSSLSFFTYGCILSSGSNYGDIDVRTLFASRGPFAGETVCREYCDKLRAVHKIPAFVHAVREKKPECFFKGVVEYLPASGSEIKKSRTVKAVKIDFTDAEYIEIAASKEILIKNMEFGRGDKWHNFKDARYGGLIKIFADNYGGLQIINVISLNELLKVVVPSEIEASAPYQAICAQAVAARSEVLAKFKTRHTESDYDFCAGTHCQAYGGLANRRSSSDRAVDETASMIMVSRGHIVDTVYHANCGGLTENSNKIWSAPFDSALIKINDSTSQVILDLSTSEAALKKFILDPPPAYCSVAGACDNADKHRWRREFSRGRLEKMIDAHYNIGRLLSIEAVERGASGRITALKITGSAGKFMIYKELPIRKLFGMLRSSLFFIEIQKKASGDTFIFHGAGWGHGVGMCQDGAKGMALSGKKFEEILRHYYSDSKILKFE